MEAQTEARWGHVDADERARIEAKFGSLEHYKKLVVERRFAVERKNAEVRLLLEQGKCVGVKGNDVVLRANTVEELKEQATAQGILDHLRTTKQMENLNWN